MRAVEDEVLVDLVGHDHRVVLVGEADHLVLQLAGEHGPSRIVRVVHEDHAGSVGDGRAQLVEVGLEVGPAQRHRDQTRTGQRDDRGVRVVVRLEDDHFIVRTVNQRQQRRGERLGRTRGDEYVATGIEVLTVEAVLMLGDGQEQIRDAATRRILIDAVGDRVAGGLEHRRRPVLVGKALPEIDRAGSGRKGRHLGEDGGAGGSVRTDEACADRRTAPGSGCFSHRVHATRIVDPHPRHKKRTESGPRVVSGRQKEQS